jgi:hypothetical protein
MSTAKGWDWFEPQEGLKPGAGKDHWQACFESPAGQKVLEDLERHFLQSALGPNTAPTAIWMREGQRALVLHIKRLATLKTDAEPGND